MVVVLKNTVWVFGLLHHTPSKFRQRRQLVVVDRVLEGGTGGGYTKAFLSCAVGGTSGLVSVFMRFREGPSGDILSQWICEGGVTHGNMTIATLWRKREREREREKNNQWNNHNAGQPHKRVLGDDVNPTEFRFPVGNYAMLFFFSLQLSFHFSKMEKVTHTSCLHLHFYCVCVSLPYDEKQWAFFFTSI